MTVTTITTTTKSKITINERRLSRRKELETTDLAITPPFKKCIVPGCYFTHITERTLNEHIAQMHPEILE